MLAAAFRPCALCCLLSGASHTSRAFSQTCHLRQTATGSDGMPRCAAPGRGPAAQAVMMVHVRAHWPPGLPCSPVCLPWRKCSQQWCPVLQAIYLMRPTEGTDKPFVQKLALQGCKTWSPRLTRGPFPVAPYCSTVDQSADTQYRAQSAQQRPGYGNGMSPARPDTSAHPGAPAAKHAGHQCSHAETCCWPAYLCDKAEEGEQGEAAVLQLLGLELLQVVIPAPRAGECSSTAPSAPHR